MRFLYLLGIGAALWGLAACAPGATPTPAAIALPTAASTRTPLPLSSVSTRVSTGQPTQSQATPTDVPQTTAPATGAPAQPTQPPQPTAAPSGNAPTNFFGVNTNGEILYNEQVRSLAILGGVQMVRTSVDWGNIEPEPGKYSWGGPDGTLKPLVDNNLTPLVLILNNAKWAADTPCGPVRDLLAFDKFMRSLAGRYPQVRYWSLYNEPDNAHYPDHPGGGCFARQDLNGNGKPDVQDYAEQLRVAWRAIHDVNPNAQLVTGAVALDNFDQESAPPGYPGGGQGGTFDYQFLPDLFAYIKANPLPNGDKYFDIVAFNFYGIYGPFWETQSPGKGVSAKANKIKSLLNQAGLDAPLLVSETGSNSQNVGAAGQSEYAVKTFTRGLASQLTHMIWWTYQDVSDSNPPPQNTWKYGLVDEKSTPKPSYSAYQTLSRELTGAAFVQPLDVQGGEGYIFAHERGNKAVVWSASDNPIVIAFSGSSVQVTDMYGGLTVVQDGTAQDRDGAVGRIGLQVGKEPVYIQLLNQ